MGRSGGEMKGRARGSLPRFCCARSGGGGSPSLSSSSLGFPKPRGLPCQGSRTPWWVPPCHPAWGPPACLHPPISPPLALQQDPDTHLTVISPEADPTEGIMDRHSRSPPYPTGKVGQTGRKQPRDTRNEHSPQPGAGLPRSYPHSGFRQPLQRCQAHGQPQ